MANEARKIQMAQVKLQKTLTAFITVMGTDAKNHFVKSFRNQGFEDDSIQRWQPRKNEISGGIARLRRKSLGSRAILVKTGDLRRSVRVISKSYRSIVVGSDLPYAQIHNDGLYGNAYGKYRFKMPKRQFIGHSNKLIRQLRVKLDSRIVNVFK
jgi:phage gpG-like protein